MATGTISVNEEESELHYGGHVTFKSTIHDRVKKKSHVYYIFVLCQPLGTDWVCSYESGQSVGPFPLPDTQNENLDWPAGMPARGTGVLIERVDQGEGRYSFNKLAECHFTVEGHARS